MYEHWLVHMCFLINRFRVSKGLKACKISLVTEGVILYSANNSEVLLAEMKSTSYEYLGAKALLSVLVFVRS